jgi:hypothetical protein
MDIANYMDEKYDTELDCRVHMGFDRQATCILEDVVPLMASPGPRITVPVGGRSLGEGRSHTYWLPS